MCGDNGCEMLGDGLREEWRLGIPDIRNAELMGTGDAYRCWAFTITLRQESSPLHSHCTSRSCSLAQSSGAPNPTKEPQYHTHLAHSLSNCLSNNGVRVIHMSKSARLHLRVCFTIYSSAGKAHAAPDLKPQIAGWFAGTES